MEKNDCGPILSKPEASEMVSNDPLGYRDVYWCFYLNEPVITAYTEEDKPYCENCDGLLETPEHRFMFHIKNPHWKKS